MSPRCSRRAYLRAAGVAGAGAVLAGCSGGDSRVPSVDMTDSLTFEPETLTVGVGETVTWRNVGSASHSVTAYGDRLPAGAAYFASGGFDAEPAARDAYPDGAVEGGDSYEHAFEAAGTYAYFCIPHERAGMTGTVEVSEG